MKNLTNLFLVIDDLISISDYAFEFQEYSHQILTIQLLGSSNFSAFNRRTLLNIRRPTHLENIHGLITYLEEKVFLPFLLDNKQNTITCRESPREMFDCNDCRNYWIKKNQNISNRVNVKCSNKLPINDPANFKNCIS